MRFVTSRMRRTWLSREPEYGAGRLLVAAERVEWRRYPWAAWILIALGKG